MQRSVSDDSNVRRLSMREPIAAAAFRLKKALSAGKWHTVATTSYTDTHHRVFRVRAEISSTGLAVSTTIGNGVAFEPVQTTFDLCETQPEHRARLLSQLFEILMGQYMRQRRTSASTAAECLDACNI